ncbi:glycosyltransferase family 2 protein [Prochlorococcus sp. AH-736-L15]|nr:glycosyltransferase family 2 protein [Prochlorococcus sp. AH-736-L15]MDA9741378.1 glycosyltransferase family 2 protein [Prochlorococcus sp. AH-736-L15]
MALKTGCVIPCHKGNNKTISIVEQTLKYVDIVVFIDDKCPFETGKVVNKNIVDNERLKIIYNSFNLGVGGSCKVGFNYLLEKRCDIILKIDADGQMNPHFIPKFIDAIKNNEAEAVKGNRFTNLKNIKGMPTIRLIGNLGLSFLNKISTGYWELFDPTNGFIALKSNIFDEIELNKIDNKYFFESDLLFQCALANKYFAQIPMPSLYADEISSLKPIKEIFRFFTKHLKNFTKRIIYQYFLLDFNVGSIDLIGFLILITTSIFLYLRLLIRGFYMSLYATPGEANLISILVIISTQLFLGFIYFDSTQKPLFRKINKHLK